MLTSGASALAPAECVRRERGSSGHRSNKVCAEPSAVASAVISPFLLGCSALVSCSQALNRMSPSIKSCHPHPLIRAAAELTQPSGLQTMTFCINMSNPAAGQRLIRVCSESTYVHQAMGGVWGPKGTPAAKDQQPAPEQGRGLLGQGVMG